jgi:hypothetical protein
MFFKFPSACTTESSMELSYRTGEPFDKFIQFTIEDALAVCRENEITGLDPGIRGRRIGIYVADYQSTTLGQLLLAVKLIHGNAHGSRFRGKG